jgi:hypothetical protein
MNEFFNFNNSLILVQHNWVWLLLAFLLGAYIGFTSSTPSRSVR